MPQRTTSEWYRTLEPGEAHRSHLLIEDPAAVEFDDYARFRAFGFEVTVCTGPEGGGCPLLKGERCSFLDEADVVLCSLDLQDPRSRAVLRTVRDGHHDVPVVVSVPEGGFGDDELLEGCEVLPGTAGMTRQVAALRRAIARRSDSWGMAVGN